MQCLKRVKEALLTVSKNVWHYRALNSRPPYIVWAEDSEGNSLWADQKKVYAAVQGTADLYTKQEFDPLVDAIQEAFTAAEIPWRLNSVQYEDDTKLIHYEWVWEVPCG